MANIYDVAQGFRRALLRRERSAAVELVQAYGVAYDRLSAQLDKLLKKIEAAKAAGETVDQAWLLREQRYFALINQVLREIGRFADRTGAVITDQQREAVRQAMADSQRLLIVAAEASPETVSGGFNRLNKGAVENMVGFLGDGSPLSSRLNQQGPLAASVFREELTSGVIQGRGSREIAREIKKRLYKDGNVPSGQLYSILRLARTETLRAYREASHQTYERNSDVLEGWYWLSALNGRRTCRACIALHGTFHQIGERMASHIQCRCTQVPGVKGVDLGIQKGTDWFANQPASVQREVLDKEGEYEAYKSGRLRLEDFVGLRRNAQWGDSYKALGLTRALAGEGQFPRDLRRVIDSPALILPRETVDPLKRYEIEPADVTVYYGGGVKDRIEYLFDRKLEDHEVAGLIGAPDSSELNVHLFRDGVIVTVDHPDIRFQERWIDFDSMGNLFIHNEVFMLYEKGGGLGRFAFAREVAWAQKLGVQYIEATAAGHKDDARFNGYYTWARFGYNARLTEDEKALLPPEFRGAQDLHDLFEQGGGEWWRENGSQRAMVFDLRPGSRSIERLKKYLKQKDDESLNKTPRDA